VRSDGPGVSWETTRTTQLLPKYLRTLSLHARRPLKRKRQLHDRRHRSQSFPDWNLASAARMPQPSCRSLRQLSSMEIMIGPDFFVFLTPAGAPLSNAGGLLIALHSPACRCWQPQPSPRRILHIETRADSIAGPQHVPFADCRVAAGR
jgi:hypothetical protein